MNPKTYRARTMADALTEVKRDLGRDAVILHTRRRRRGGLFGLFGRRMWEIDAAPNLNVPPRLPKGKYVPVLAEPAAPEAPAPAPARPVEADEFQSGPKSLAGALGRQMTDLCRMVERLVSRDSARGDGDLPEPLADLETHLVEQDVDPELAASLVGELRMHLTGRELADAGLLHSRLLDLIADKIATVGPHVAETAQAGRRVIALIGPTGVGKTTTIAKLAANFRLREGKSVGMITLDTFRIAAVDQLKTYADIIEVPLQPVLTAGELHQAVYAMRDRDVVLVDTAGRSQNNQLRINQLRGFLAAAAPDEVHLVVSTTSNRKCARNTLAKFAPLGVNRIIMSKLDEAESFGTILNVAAAGKAPLSYVTTGQDVPDDFAPADARRLADCVMTGALGARVYAS